jgi:hypothetical protein
VRRALLFRRTQNPECNLINLALELLPDFRAGFGIEAVFLANLAASMMMTLVVWDLRQIF